MAEEADFKAQVGLQTDLIQRLNSDHAALEAGQNQLERESQELTALIQRKIAAAQAKATSGISILTRGTGIFTYPSAGRISSPFGWRTHPILRRRRFHSGLDFATSHGSPMRAADSGTVIFSCWYGGYGKTVIINHGKEIRSFYGHSSNIHVTEGQSV